MKQFRFLKSLRWGDYVVALLLLAASLTAWNWNRSAEAQRLFVEIRQRSQRSLYPLDKERSLVLRDDAGKKVMLVQIQNARVWVQESDCPLQYCVQRGAIERTGQWIACLPNQTFIRVMGRANGNYGINENNAPFSLDAEVF